MLKYCVWNNKGGTGKTSLTFQMICDLAANKQEKILVLDLCPQANLSEIFLGGQVNQGSDNLYLHYGDMPRKSIAGYFEQRMISPYSWNDMILVNNFITNPSKFNKNIPSNIDLICGDTLIEIQSLAFNTLANHSLPTINTWLKVVEWVKDLLDKIQENEEYSYVFIDTNPSFSMYTQMALAASDLLIIPVMADDSSRRALQNIFSLVYGYNLSSNVYDAYTFSSKMKNEQRTLPKIHLVVKNRITQYMGDASAYAAVLKKIEEDVDRVLHEKPEIFSFDTVNNGLISIRDFQTVGVVAFARGCPFFNMKAGSLNIGTKRVQIKSAYLENNKQDIKKLIEKVQ